MTAQERGRSNGALAVVWVESRDAVDLDDRRRPVPEHPANGLDELAHDLGPTAFGVQSDVEAQSLTSVTLMGRGGLRPLRQWWQSTLRAYGGATAENLDLTTLPGIPVAGTVVDTVRYPIAVFVVQSRAARERSCHQGQPRVDWVFTFTAAVYNLVRMRNLAVVT